MKFDYSKTINEQLPTFNYYKDRYCSYELELINDRKEIERLNNIINEFERLLQQDLENEKDTYWTNITKEDYMQFMLNKLQELKRVDKQ